MPAFLAAMLCLLRWWLQGGTGVWTKLSMRPYLPHPDLGWRRHQDDMVWLGLDAVGLCLVLAALFMSVAWVARRRSWRGRVFQLIFSSACLAPLAIPAYALLSSGAVPKGARTTLPATERESATSIQAHLPGLPQGHYELLAHSDAGITVTLQAGGERFDARFVGELTGRWEGDPAALGEPMSGQVSVASASIDTDLGERDDHAREYLKVSDYPRLTFELTGVTGSRPGREDTIEISLDGELSLMGGTLPLSFDGTLSAPDKAARERLSLPGGPLFLLDAQTQLDLRRTPIENPSDLFDELDAVIHLTLFWVPANP